jgi:hypothetical protein
VSLTLNTKTPAIFFSQSRDWDSGQKPNTATPAGSRTRQDQI